jgi:hypothetical protein
MDRARIGKLDGVFPVIAAWFPCYAEFVPCYFSQSISLKTRMVAALLDGLTAFP